MDAPKIVAPSSHLSLLGMSGTAFEFESATELMAGPQGNPLEKHVLAQLPAHSMILVLPPETAAQLRPHMQPARPRRLGLV